MGGATRRRWQSLAMVVLAMASVAALLAYAVLADGYPVRKVDLNDSGVWVTSNSDATFGRYNKSASYLDAYFNPPGGSQGSYDLDVLQDQGSVVAFDVAGGAVYPVDVATGRSLKDAGAEVTATTVLKMGGGTIAALDPTTGKLWAMRYAAGSQVPALGSIASSAAPLANVGAPPKGDTGPTFAALAVDVHGGVHVVTRAGRLVDVPVSGGSFAKPVSSTVAEKLGSVEVSAIGRTPVVLDAGAGTVLVAGHSATLPVQDGAARLQSPVAGGALAVASSTGLYSVDASGSAVKPLSDTGGGAPASPVEASGCLWAAWAGTPGTVSRSCDGGPVTPVGIDDLGTLSRPVFRVNRGVAVLNDVTDGGIVDLELKQRLNPWEDVRPPDQQTQDQAPKKQQVEDKKNKPKAVDDDLGARPGLTTILHVLDNDTDPSGKPLSISAVTAPGNPNAMAVVSPDGQTIRYTLSRAGGDSEFQYDVSNGVNTARGTVSVSAASGNKEPEQRRVEPQPFTVASGGTLPVPVIDTWRDRDGDPVTIKDVTPERGSAIGTPDGRIEFTAPGTGEGGTVRLDYTVTDGRGKPQKGRVDVTVQAGNAGNAVPAITQPDVARGEVRRPIDLAPLTNDTQGSDPRNPTASLVLADDVAGEPGIRVETDVSTGRVVAVAEKPGTYFLAYAAGYGSAAISPGQIRVDALKPGAADHRPVAMPDHAAVHGQAPVLVDVLANDVDPAGGMLTVVSAAAEDPSQAQVAVLKGRWLRVMPSTDAFDSGQQVIHYTVTNGGTEESTATGDLVVTQLEALTPDPPIARPDYATVRDGDSVLIPVLDNDATAGGRPLSLRADVEGSATAGTLTVVDPAAKDKRAAGDVGKAYVVGNRIRYVAPAKVESTRTLEIRYTALNDALDPGDGTVEVTVNPQPGPDFENRAPSAKPLEARAIAGETYTIDVESSGNDPDGDSTAVAGLASAPTLGRVLATTPTGIRYQAYPTSAGLDSFSYVITDRYGQQSTSLVRVAVSPAGLPQPAVAVADTIMAAPGTTVTVAPLANDFYARTDVVRVRPLAETNDPRRVAAQLDRSTNTVTVTTPSGPPTKVAYGIVGNGGESALSEIVVIGQEGYQNPPRVFDQVATADGGGTASADVLKTAYDPDGNSADLAVTKVHLTGGSATVSGGRITVPTKPYVQAVPFEVTDEAKATSVAVLHVPATAAPGPFVRPDALIRVDTGATATVALADVVADGAGKPVMLPTTDRRWASPDPGLSVEVTDTGTFTVTGAKGYTGPAAVTLEVSNGRLGDPVAVTRVLTVPVQVGPETPVLRCPTGALSVIAGGKPLTVDPMSLCSVWTPTASMASELTFAAEWVKEVPGVSVTGSGGRNFALDPAGSATPGATGTLKLSAVGTKAEPSLLKVKVVAAEPPVLAPIELPEMKQGEAREVNLRSYLRSPLKDSRPTAVSVIQVSGQRTPATWSGSIVRITPGSTAHGPMVFKVVASDVPDLTRTDRQVSGTISFEVYGVPDAPTRPQPGSSTLSHSAVLSWAAPAANGAPIRRYEVKWAGSQQDCAASPCTITGLNNGQEYSFSVRAVNKAGQGAWSPTSARYKPDDAPKAVPDFRQTKASDGSVTLAWSAAVVDGSDVTNYVIAVNGKSKSCGRVLSCEIKGLENGPTYTFTIYAENDFGPGPSSRAKGSSAGKPIFDGPVDFAPVAAADADSTALKVVWPAGDQNGPSQIKYTVTRAPDGKTVCSGVANTFCDDEVKYGSTYTYSVVAKTTFLGVTRESATQSASINPSGTPAGVTGLSVSSADSTVTVSFSVPNPRGNTCVAHVRATGPGGSAGSWSDTCQEGQSLSQTITGMRNGDTITVEAWISNSKYEGPKASAVPSHPPWGSLEISNLTTSLSGSAVNATASSPSAGNGGKATLTLTIDGKNAKTCTFAALASNATCSGSLDQGYIDRDVEVVATLANADGSISRSTRTLSRSVHVPAPPSVPVSPYNNYGSANAGHAMCLGNPARPESMPGGTARQTFVVPSGVAYLNSAKIQIDPNGAATAHFSISVNGSQRATAAATLSGDTHFNFSNVPVRQGDQVSFSVTFTATSGKLTTVYTAGSPGGTFTASNSCSDGAPNVSTGSTGLRAVISGMS